MATSKSLSIIPDEVIINKIYFIRGQKVMLDKDLADIYNVTTGNLNKAVKRNLRRFPPDFMFQLTEKEHSALIFQFGITKPGRGGSRKRPFVFTEQGVCQLSAVLNSETAIEMSVRLARIFIKLRELLLTHKDILLKLEQLESQVIQNSGDIHKIFVALRELLSPPKEKRRPIGFKLAARKKK